MSLQRVLGTETEYGVARQGGQQAAQLAEAGVKPYNPVELSFAVVAAAAAGDPARAEIRWDYRREDPVRDARGSRLDRASARPDMLTDAPQLQISNVIAPNGGRIYVDHAHPEYSSPETRDPFQALLYDRAGDAMMAKAAAGAGGGLELYKNNVDGKGASWGSHENYLMERSVPFEQVAQLMTLHLVSRQIYTGSGRLGLGEASQKSGFQLSQRADYLHTRIGLQTTFDRPIINTRDEPHAGERYRRLHVIAGDANRMDWPQALKLGTTSLLLWVLEEAASTHTAFDLAGLLDDLALADPVQALHTVSRDMSLSADLPLASGGSITAWQLQLRLLTATVALAAEVYGTDGVGNPLWPDESSRRMLGMWQTVLADLAQVRHSDDDQRLHMAVQASRLEWLLKWQILEGLRRKLACSWRDPRLSAADLRWESIDQQTSIFEKVRGRAAALVNDDQVLEAMTQPPDDTRAWLRAELVRNFPQELVAVSWSQITVRQASRPSQAGGQDDHGLLGEGEAGQGATRGLVTLDMSDPLSFCREDCQALLESWRGRPAAGLIAAIKGNG
ncbi:proteasome accessory factor PafA2 [Bifidobacterium aemilianum]|uniref:Proteasome accessory factor PafA2 n=1 Tax=Bifidobacterium aemilianum TaxID=2493120 RepID=A0A366K9K4_9BIFI|nr:depupylase/deamidase Dop [Bifidobacterium aemilianum]RBP98425.1 proteasome accessory factor PafA2 [Bifidobacterium aemilianum]